MKETAWNEYNNDMLGAIAYCIKNNRPLEKEHITWFKKQCEIIFPKLEESEDDEMIKWIIDDIRYNMNNEPLNNSEYKKKAEKAMIEKACKWIKENFENYVGVDVSEYYI